MYWLQMQMTLLDFATAVVGLAANWLVQSTLLIAAGLTVGWLLRRRGAALQSIIYRTTLAAVILCPLASFSLSLGGVSGWSIQMPVAWTYDQQSRPMKSFAPSQPALAPSQSLNGQAKEIEPSKESASGSRQMPAAEARSSSPSTAAFDDGSSTASKRRPASSAIAVPAPTTTTMPVETWRFEVRSFGIAALGIAFAWLTISSVLLLRLGLAWRQLAQLRRGAAAVEAATQHECRELAALLGVAAPRVLRSPYLTSPCLAGLLRPAVLLPETDRALPLRDILIHELAHLSRGDNLWNLLRRLAEALFFYQPLLWIVTRQLEATAEEVCDDYVLQSGGNREEYARRLVDIAELCIAPVGAAGVAMVSLRSILARRIRRIVDPARPLSTQAGKALLALVVAAGLVSTVAVGLIGSQPRPLLAADDPAGSKASDERPSTDGGALAIQQPGADKVVEGQITDENGRPISGVHVAVIARLIQPARGGDFDASSAVLTEGTTDKDGQYRLSVQGVSAKTHAYVMLIARKEGMALAWQQRDLDVPKDDAPLKLVAEEPLRVKLLDAKGKPAAGVRVAIRGILKRSNSSFAAEGVGYSNDNKVPAAWLPPVAADDEGRLVLHGVPAGHGVYLEVEKTDRFAPQDISLNTGAAEQRGERDGTYRDLIKNVKPGEEAVLMLAPAQPFEGVVRYADTGEVAPHARITIWASDQEPVGSMVTVAGQADGKGHYRITPKPGIRFGVTAYPPDGAAYLARQTGQNGIRWEAGDEVKEVNLSLPRGVLVKGQVVEAGTGTPVSGVSVQYMPERLNNRNVADDILTGWQALQISDKNGHFSIVALPGPGHLLAHSAIGNYVLQETSDRELALGKPGGERTYAHAITKIDPKAGAESLDVKFELQPGLTVMGKLVDEHGKLIEEALVVSRLNVSRFSLDWRGHTEPVLGGKFELTGLAKDAALPVYFLDAKRQLGASEVINASDDMRTVTLKPCGKAKLRVVDSEGKPVAGHYANVEMVVTPGAARYDNEAAKRGELTADADFVANVDRTNYPDMKKSDERGNLLLPALIPGADYQIYGIRAREGRLEVVKEFRVKAGETLDLGDLALVSEK